MNTHVRKVIHYCWFGGKLKPESVNMCLASWRKNLPEFEIIEWNETNFDLRQHPFIEKAYFDRKWAFVSDYVRLKVLQTYGGLYLDTDVELFYDVTSLLNARLVLGVERNGPFYSAMSAFIFAEAGHPLLTECLTHYDTITNENRYRPNTEMLRDILERRYGWVLVDKNIDLNEGVRIYNSAVLCAPNMWHRSYGIHHFSGSWTASPGRSIKVRSYSILLRICPLRLGWWISKLLLNVRTTLR